MNRLACHGCHRPGDRILRVVSLDYPTAAVHARLRADMLRMLGLAAEEQAHGGLLAARFRERFGDQGRARPR